MEQPMNVMQSWSNYCVHCVTDLDLETAIEMANQLRAKYDIPVPE